MGYLFLAIIGTAIKKPRDEEIWICRGILLLVQQQVINYLSSFQKIVVGRLHHCTSTVNGNSSLYDIQKFRNVKFGY